VTNLKLANTSPQTCRCDALVVFTVPHGDAYEIRHDGLLSEETAAALHELLNPVRRGHTPPTAVVVPAGDVVRADVVVFALAAELTDEAIRQAAGVAVRAVADRESVAVLSPGAGAAHTAAAAMGALLGSYRFAAYKTAAAEQTTLTDLTVLTGATRRQVVKDTVATAELTAHAVAAVRDLVNTPPGDLTPVALAEYVRRAAADTPVRVETWDVRKLERLGFGGLLAVGQGSTHPPALVRMTYRPPRAKSHLALVGKGVTFDSGGLSLKSPTAMITMKSDMAGAATMAMVTLAIARLKLPVRITTYLPLAENLPSGTAQRPGDVITSYNGTTIEVLNTDAEGRLIMADALARACEDEPDLIVDVATLTGAQVVALGTHVGAVMANSDKHREQVVAAAHTAGEFMWPMPLPEELRPSLDSKIADIANIGERMGGMLTAGVFLQEFVTPGVPWVHLDIAGPAFNEQAPRGYTPSGGTGFAVRTLVALAAEIAERSS